MLQHRLFFLQSMSIFVSCCTALKNLRYVMHLMLSGPQTYFYLFSLLFTLLDVSSVSLNAAVGSIVLAMKLIWGDCSLNSFLLIYWQVFAGTALSLATVMSLIC